MNGPVSVGFGAFEILFSFFVSVNVANNFLVPKDGTPLGGLIQDHVVAGVKMTMRGRFFNREDYQQLVFVALSHIKRDLELLPPAIIKPVALWSGKQVGWTVSSSRCCGPCANFQLNPSADPIDHHQKHFTKEQGN